MKRWFESDSFRLWLSLVGAAALLLGAAYAMVQQSTRLAADDLPLQTAESIRYQLSKGATAQDAIPAVKTDLRVGNTAFAIITNDSQDVLASSASLDGKTPLPPAGVFDYTKDNGSDHFTWQPAAKVRLATRIVSYSANGGGYIIAGQSLKQAEDRINIYGELAIAAWLAMTAWVTLVMLFLKPLPKAPKTANRQK